MRLAIYVPSNRDHNPRFTLSLLALNQHLCKQGVRGVEGFQFLTKIWSGCSNIAQARQELVQEARRQGMTHLLFLDDDMTFPPDLLDTFASRGVPVVAANCCKKTTADLCYTAMGFDGNVIESKGKTGTQEAAQVGTGVMLIDLEAVGHVEDPWFSMQWLPKEGRTCGEDVFFCWRLREHGVKMYVDHDVSNAVGHVGSYEFRFESFREKPAA